MTPVYKMLICLMIITFMAVAYNLPIQYVSYDGTTETSGELTPMDKTRVGLTRMDKARVGLTRMFKTRINPPPPPKAVWNSSICTRSSFRQYYKDHGYYPGGTWHYTGDYNDQRSALTTDFCQFKENVISPNRLEACLQKKKYTDIIIMGDSNGRNYFMTFVHLFAQATGNRCRVAKMANNYDKATNTRNNFPKGFLKKAAATSVSYFTRKHQFKKDDHNGDKIGKEITSIVESFAKDMVGTPPLQSRPNAKYGFIGMDDYFAEGDEKLKERMSIQPRPKNSFASTQIICQRGTNPKRPAEIKIEFLFTNGYPKNGITLDPSSEFNDTINSLEDYYFKLYLRRRKKPVVFLFFAAKHFKWLENVTSRDAMLIHHFTSVVKDFVAPNRRVFLIPEFGEDDSRKSPEFNKHRWNGEKCNKYIEKINHMLYREMEEALLSENEHALMSYFDLRKLAETLQRQNKGKRSWSVGGSHLVSRYYELIASYLLQILCES